MVKKKKKYQRFVIIIRQRFTGIEKNQEYYPERV